MSCCKMFWKDRNAWGIIWLCKTRVRSNEPPNLLCSSQGSQSFQFMNKFHYSIPAAKSFQLRLPWTWTKTSSLSGTLAFPFVAVNASLRRFFRWPCVSAKSWSDKLPRWRGTRRAGWRRWFPSSTLLLGCMSSTRWTTTRRGPSWTSSLALARTGREVPPAAVSCNPPTYLNWFVCHVWNLKVEGGCLSMA